MNELAAPGLTLAALEQLLIRLEPAAMLVPPRILRRVIKQDRGLSGLGLQVPHRKSYVLSRDVLLRLATPGELGLSPERPLPETVLLFPRPEDTRLQRRPRGLSLIRYWRLLFHARIHLAFRQRNLDIDTLRQRVRQLGITEFNEARAVLRQENFLLPPEDGATVYEEFAALYLELRYFAPHLLRRYFPALTHPEAVERLLAEDVDAAALFAATRPPGAPEPNAPDDPFQEPTPTTNGSESRILGRPDEGAYAKWMAKAERAASVGNVVRAALLRCRALDVAPHGQRSVTRDALQAAIAQLTERLQRALGFSDRERSDWERGMRALVPLAAHGFWPPEAGLLFDLQKVCVESEREAYAVDLVEWFVTWGRRPVKRPLPNLRWVRVVQHLRHALNRMTSARLPDQTRRPLTARLREAVHHSEQALRDHLRPRINGALDQVDLAPANQAERVARDKLVEELLDRVVQRGFLNMSDLRDAIARSRLKLPDLSGPGEFFGGDRLLRANRRFATDLDGVYHRGEIYLRWLQRFSSLFFGTVVGRLLSLYLILPLLGAFILLKGAEEVYEIGLKLTGHSHQAPPPSKEQADEEEAHDPHHLGHHQPHFVNRYSFGITAVFVLGLLHSTTFRRWVLMVLRLLWYALRGVCYDLPAALLGLPWVRAVLQSRPWLVFYLFVLKPLLWAAPVPGILYLLGVDTTVVLVVGGVIFIAATVLLNSRLGMHLEEATADGLIRTWVLIRDDLVPGLLRAIIWLFKWLVDYLDRLIYSVDEWLRFRQGDARFWLYVKPVLGLFWFLISYVVRFAVNLLIEPQINPVKHFPVVTVSHKVLLLGLKPTAGAMATTFQMTEARALAVTGGIFALIPGIFGFLAWELKENWRLYRSNQPETLEPEVVGEHGETVVRLLRPGFHSGTLPRLFARLRRTERRLETTGVRKQREALHHVEEEIRHFVDRTLVAVLAGSKAWGTPLLEAGAIRLATNRIRIELCRPGAGASVALELELQGGRVVAGFAPKERSAPTWLAALTEAQTTALMNALAGFYKRAGVELVREQAQALLPAGAAFALTEEGLIVWAGPGSVGLGRYELDEEVELTPVPVAGGPEPDLPTLSAERLLFRRVPVRWVDWVTTWERDQDGKGHERLTPGVRLLPG